MLNVKFVASLLGLSTVLCLPGLPAFAGEASAENKTENSNVQYKESAEGTQIDVKCVIQKKNLLCTNPLNGKRVKIKHENFDRDHLSFGYTVGSEAQATVFGRIVLDGGKVGFSVRPRIQLGYKEDDVNTGLDARRLARNPMPGDLTSLGQSFQQGLFDAAINDDKDSIEEYLDLELGLDATLDYNAGRWTFFAGPGIGATLFTGENDDQTKVYPRLIGGIERYIGKSFVISITNSTNFVDGVDNQTTFGVGLSF